MRVLFYHPKNPSNIVDAYRVATSVGAGFCVVERPGAGLPRLSNIVVYKSFEEFLSTRSPWTYYVVLETYGDKCIDEITIPSDYEEVVVIIGAEDYGLPLNELEKIPASRRAVARIPLAVEGASLNVVASLAIGLHYVVEALEGEAAEAVRSNNFIDFLFK